MTITHKNNFLFLPMLLLAVLTNTMPAKAASAQEVVEKGAAKLRSARGIKASFTLQANGHPSNGTLYAKGSKFSVITPFSSTWYNGSLLYTYNPKSNETTLTRPTVSELPEVNPLLYLNSSVSSFNCSFAKTQPKGCFSVILTPKKAKTGLKSVGIILNSSTFMPERITVVTTSGTSSTVVITSISISENIPETTFNYPKSKYQNTEIIDLR